MWHLQCSTDCNLKFCAKLNFISYLKESTDHLNSSVTFKNVLAVHQVHSAYMHNKKSEN